jgi:hypothetical protein
LESSCFVSSSKLLSKPIPRMLKIGKYIARVFHPGQPEFQNRNYTQDSDKTCHKLAKARSICPSSADRGTFLIFILIVSG